MTKTQRLMQIAVVAAALLLPATAFASGPVHDALAGTVVDPMATTVKVVPPRGGSVMMYRHGQLVGWFVQPGLVSVQPGRVYNVVASRGNYMVFNAGVMVHDGYTEMSWGGGGSTPQIAYIPSYHRQPYRVAAHRSPRAAAYGVRHRDSRRRAVATSTPRKPVSAAAKAKPAASKKVVDASRRRRVLRSVKTRAVPKKRVSNKAVKRPLRLKTSALRKTRVARATR